MVGERLDDPAVGNQAASTLARHALEFDLERLQPCDAALDLLKLTPSNSVGSLAGIVRGVRQT